MRAAEKRPRRPVAHVALHVNRLLRAERAIPVERRRGARADPQPPCLQIARSARALEPRGGPREPLVTRGFAAERSPLRSPRAPSPSPPRFCRPERLRRGRAAVARAEDELAR